MDHNSDSASPAGGDSIESSLLADCPDLIDIVEEFVRSLPQRAEAMQEALRAESYEQLARFAHQLKGSGGSHGYPQLTAEAIAIEHGARAHAIDDVTRKLDELHALIRRIQAGLPGTG